MQDVWQEFAASRDPALRQALILQYIPLVHWVVERIGVYMPAVASKEDYVSEGTVGLIEAVDRYDPDSGYQFATYATQRIRGAVLDSLRSLTQSRRGRSAVWDASLDALMGEAVDDDAFTLADLLPDPRAVDPEQAAESADLWRLVRALPERERAIIGFHYGRGLPKRRVGEAYGIGESWVSLLHQRALRRLREAIGGADE